MIGVITDMMGKNEKKEIVLDILQAYMQGAINQFHVHMEKAETELTQEEFNQVKQLLEMFPKQYENCIDVIYQCLVTIVEAKAIANVPEVVLDEVPLKMDRLEVEDHWFK